MIPSEPPTKGYNQKLMDFKWAKLTAHPNIKIEEVKNYKTKEKLFMYLKEE